MLNLRYEFHKLSTSINFAERNGVIKLAEIEIYVFSFYLCRSSRCQVTFYFILAKWLLDFAVGLQWMDMPNLFPVFFF